MNRKMISEHSSRARGKLKIGDDWNAITIIALSQTSPLKAIAELVENSIDAKADWNKKGRPKRARSQCSAVSPTRRTCNRGGLARWRASRRPRDAPGGPDLGESYANTGGFQHLRRLT
jgi:hypothetical protein